MTTINFPVLIEFTDSHGLEDSAEEGRDFFKYKVIFSIKDFPLSTSFKIIGSVHPQNIKEVI